MLARPRTKERKEEERRDAVRMWLDCGVGMGRLGGRETGPQEGQGWADLEGFGPRGK